MSRLRVLGCAGGIGGGRHTTSFLLDDHILIDAGTGVCTLTLPEIQGISTILLTHSHLDHVLGIPLLLDAISPVAKTKPLTVYGLRSTLAAIKENFFNGQIWPRIEELGEPGSSVIEFREISVGDDVLEGKVSVLPANHAVAACGYLIQGDHGALVFTGDTRAGAALWDELNKHKNLTHLIIETSYLNQDESVAQKAYHLTPSQLAVELEGLKTSPEILITHLKPGYEAGIMDEVIRLLGAKRNVSALNQGEVLSF